MKTVLKDIVINEFDAKKYLSQIAKINTRLDSELKQLRELQQYKCSISSVDYSKPFIITNTVSDTVSGIVVKLVDLENNIKKDIYRYTIIKQEIIDLIYQVDDLACMNLLKMRYVDMMSLEAIAVEMNYVYGYVRRLHSRALEYFKCVYLKNNKSGNTK